jgi:hypothetical protein
MTTGSREVIRIHPETGAFIFFRPRAIYLSLSYHNFLICRLSRRDPDTRTPIPGPDTRYPDTRAFFAGVTEGAQERKRVVTQIPLFESLQTLLYLGS